MFFFDLTMLGFLFAVVVVAVIAIAICLLAMKLWFFVTTLSVICSRLAMSLLIATGSSLFAFKLEVFDSGFLNFILRTAIVYGIIYIVSFLPRVSAAIGTACTAIIALLASMMTVGLGFTIYDAIAKSDTKFSNSPWFYIIMGVIVIFATGYNWLQDIDRLKELPHGPAFLQSKWGIRVGRVVASLIYGFALYMILGLTFNKIVPATLLIQYLLYFGSVAVAYVADLFLFDRAA